MQKFISFFIPLLFFSFTSIYAQDSTNDQFSGDSAPQPTVQASEEETTLETFVVTAGREKQKKSEVAQSIQVIDEEEIQNAPVKDVGELLAQKSTGHIHKYPGASTSIGIRGFRTDTHGNDLRGKVLILLNGRRAGTGNLAKIMTKNVERIEVIRGPASVQYGSAGIGGVINIITKKGQEDSSVFIEGAAGSYKYQETGFGFQGKKDLFDFSGSFSESSRGDYETAENDEYKNTSIDRQVNYSLNLGFTFQPENRIGLILNGYDADGIGTPNQLAYNDLDDYINDSNVSYDIIYQGSTRGKIINWKARYFSGEDKYEYYFVNNGTKKLYPTITKSNGAQAQVQYKGDYASILLGYDKVYYDKKSNTEQSTYLNVAPFILGKLKLLKEKLILNSGFRSDQFEVTYIRENNKHVEETSNVSRQFGSVFILQKGIRLRANYGEGFIVPSASELGAEYSQMEFVPPYGTYNYVGNANLKPETSVTREVGFDFKRSSLDAAFTYFRTKYSDKIEEYDVSSDTKSWKNLGSASIAGYEGKFSFDMGELLNWNYEVKPYFNFLKHTQYQDDDANEKLQYVSDSQASYGFVFNNQRGLIASLNYAYTGKQRYKVYGSDTLLEKDAFTVADLSVSKTFESDSAGKLKINGAVNNLTNEDYAYVDGYPMPGRAYTLGVKYEY